MFECGAKEGDGFVFESESCVVCALIKAVELGGVAVYGELYELFSVRVVFAGERVKEVICVFFKAAAAGVKGYVMSPRVDAFVGGDSFDDIFVGVNSFWVFACQISNPFFVDVVCGNGMPVLLRGLLRVLRQRIRCR